MYKKIILFVLLISVIFSGVFFYQSKKTNAEESGGLGQMAAQLGTDLGIYTAATQGAGGTAQAEALLGVPVNDPATLRALQIEKPASKAVDTKSKILQAMFDMILQNLKKKMLDMIVDQIVNWIQGGGTPQFVSDWQGFLKKAADVAFDSVVKDVGLTQICDPFNFQIQASLLPVQRFPVGAQCTVSKIVGNVKNFYNDFQNGGWLAYGQTWSPQNNVYGMQLMVDDELAVKTSASVNAREQEAVSGKGFLSVKTCVQKNQDQYKEFYKECKDNSGTDAECADYADQQAACVKEEVKTPGSFVGDITAKTFGSQLDYIINSKDLSAYVGAIVNAGINRMVSEGLNAMVGSNSGPQTGQNYTKPFEDALSSIQKQDKDRIILDLNNISNDRAAVLANKNKSLQVLQNTLKTYQQIGQTYCSAQVSAQDISTVNDSISKINVDIQNLNDSISKIGQLVAQGQSVSSEYKASQYGVVDVVNNNIINQVTSNAQHVTDMQDFVKAYNDFVNNNGQLIYDASSGKSKTDSDNELKTFQANYDQANKTFTTCSIGNH